MASLKNGRYIFGLRLPTSILHLIFVGNFQFPHLQSMGSYASLSVGKTAMVRLPRGNPPNIGAPLAYNRLTSGTYNLLPDSILGASSHLVSSL